MTLRKGHGTGAGQPRVEVMPVDELPEGVAAAQPRLQALPRPPYAAGSAAAREAGRRGGKQKAGTTALASGLGLAKAFADESFERYRNAAENFAHLHVRRLAETVGGGEVGPGPSSIVWSAGLQLAASRWAFEVVGDPVLGSKLANDSRQNLLAAHELCAREATARPRDAMADLNRRLEAYGAPPTSPAAARADVEASTDPSDEAEAFLEAPERTLADVARERLAELKGGAQ